MLMGMLLVLQILGHKLSFCHLELEKHCVYTGILRNHTIILTVIMYWKLSAAKMQVNSSLTTFFVDTDR